MLATFGYVVAVADDIGDTIVAGSRSTPLPDPDSSLWHWLAHDLRLYRERRDLSLAQVGRIIGHARQHVSAMEFGRRRITTGAAERLDLAWDTGGHFQRLLRFARLNHDPDWFRQHVQHEARANELRIYESMWIPGILQTPDYARASLATAGICDESMVDTRMARQEILAKERPPLLWIILDQAVLLRPVRGPDVMRAQLERVVSVSELPNSSVRVVPLSAGAYQGMDGAFKLMRVDAGLLAYVEAPAGGRLIQDPDEVREFGLRYDRVGAKALPEDLSRGLIVEAMEKMR